MIILPIFGILKSGIFIEFKTSVKACRLPGRLPVAPDKILPISFETTNCTSGTTLFVAEEIAEIDSAVACGVGNTRAMLLKLLSTDEPVMFDAIVFSEDFNPGLSLEELIGSSLVTSARGRCIPGISF